MMTGYFANTKTSTKVHLVYEGKPVCGSRVRKKQFCWCADGLVEDYLECESCKKIAVKLLKERIGKIK